MGSNYIELFKTSKNYKPLLDIAKSLDQVGRWGRNTGWETFFIAKSVIMMKDDVVITVSRYNPSGNYRVVTELTHPKQGRTRLYRKVRTQNAIRRIMYHPRIHSKKAYRKEHV